MQQCKQTTPMTRDYDKERLILQLDRLRLDGIAGAARLVTQRLASMTITDNLAGTTKEIQLSKLSKDEFIIKLTEVYNEIYAVEVGYILEKNLTQGPYITVSWKRKPPIINLRGPGFKQY